MRTKSTPCLPDIHVYDEAELRGLAAGDDRCPFMEFIADAWTEYDVAMYLAGWYKRVSKLIFFAELLVGGVRLDPRPQVGVDEVVEAVDLPRARARLDLVARRAQRAAREIGRSTCWDLSRCLAYNSDAIR